MNVRTERAGTILSAALVFVAAFIMYLPSLKNDFAYDDVAIIALDARVRDFDLDGILTRGYWQDTASALYRPLTTLSYAADWQISGGAPVWFHFTNAWLHGVVSVLVLLLLLRLRMSTTAAVLGGALFAFHPVHVEAVANVVGRAELIAACAVLLAALLWTRPAERLQRAPGLAALGALFALALLAKEVSVVLPGLLVTVDVAMDRIRPGRLTDWLRSRFAPLCLCAAMIVLFISLRSLLPGSITPENLDPSLEVLDSSVHRLFTALQAWPQYARLLFVPVTLLADYGPRIIMPAVSVGPAVTAGLVLLTLSTIGAGLAWERRCRRLAAALLWFAIAIFPVSNLIVPIGVLVAERTLYLPSVGLSIGAAAAISAVRWPAATLPRVAIAAVAGVVLGLLVVRSALRIPDWKNTNTVMAALIRDRPDAFRGVWHFARLDAAHGLHASAARRFAEALDLWPYRQRLVREAALHAQGMREHAYAASLMDYALERWPDELILRRVRAGSLLDMGDTAASRRHIEAGLRFHPSDSLLLRMRAATASGSSP